MAAQALQLNSGDNVATLMTDTASGDFITVLDISGAAISTFAALERIPRGHKVALTFIDIQSGIKTAGHWPTQLFWFAGGVPAVMKTLKKFLHLDAMTVTGKTVGENLEDLENEGYFRRIEMYLKNYGLKKEQIIQSLDEPYYTGGGLAVLTGNIAPEGSVVKHSAAVQEMHFHIGPAKPFDCEEDAIFAILDGSINPGDVIIIRYEGSKGAGMLEMLKTTEAIYNRPEMVSTTALITDGRFPARPEDGPLVIFHRRLRMGTHRNGS